MTAAEARRAVFQVKSAFSPCWKSTNSYRFGSSVLAGSLQRRTAAIASGGAPAAQAPKN
jgi:hypothetical protein